MQIIEAIFLGLIQGLTEFIPVSSSGHLILAEKLFHLDTGGLLFDVMLHVGTLLALVIYFRRDLWQLLRAFGRPKADRLWLYVIIGTVPAVIFGLIIQELAEGAFRSVGLVAFNLVAVGILMLVVERVAANKGLSSMKAVNALFIGIAQALALVPGVSRSGITITAGMAQRFKREASARFAFLLAIPITFGAILKLLWDGGATQINSNGGVFVVGVLTAALSGYLAVDFLLKYLEKRSLAVFAYYRFGLAAIILIITLVN